MLLSLPRVRTGTESSPCSSEVRSCSVLSIERRDESGELGALGTAPEALGAALEAFGAALEAPEVLGAAPEALGAALKAPEAAPGALGALSIFSLEPSDGNR